MARRGSVVALVVLLSGAASTAMVAAEEAYVGTVTVPADVKPVSTPLQLTIRQYTSHDQAFAMAERLHKGGAAAAAAEMAKGDVGTVRLGEQSYRATVVRQLETDTGRTVRVVLDRPVHAAEAAGKPPADAVGYVELELGAAGEGTGKVMTAVRAAFDAEGWVVPESLGETWAVSNVKPAPAK